MQNPLYKLWQQLPGQPSKGQTAITQFHDMMNGLLQEVTKPRSAPASCACLMPSATITVLTYHDLLATRQRCYTEGQTKMYRLCLFAHGWLQTAHRSAHGLST